MKTYVFALSLILSISQVSWSQSRSERKALKKEKETKAYQQTKELLDSGTFFFNAEWMYPRNSSQVNLINNFGFITFKTNEKIDMHLPYFGIVRIGGGFNQSQSITHEGVIDSYKIVHNDAKQTSKISFAVKASSELYNITMSVYSNGNSSIFVNSTKRDGIRYRGKISPSKESLLTGK